MLLSNCAICGSINWRFIKKKEGKELLNNLGLRALLGIVPLLGNI